MGQVEETVLSRRIMRLLGGRHAMHIGELQMRLGVGAAAVRAVLGEMIGNGKIVMLRPINCNREDHDFFRLNRPPPSTARMGAQMTALRAGNAEAPADQAGRTLAEFFA
jgi:hypothetical protein